MKPNFVYDAGVWPLLPRHLDIVTWIISIISFSWKNNITVTVKKGSRWYGWLNAGETSWKFYSINYFNDSIDNSILYYGKNSCGIIDILSIEITFDSYHIHVLNDLKKRYIYRYLISKLMISETTIQNMILQNICLLLIWDDVK